MITLLLCVMILGLLQVWMQWLKLEQPTSLDEHWQSVRRVLREQATQSD